MNYQIIFVSLCYMSKIVLRSAWGGESYVLTPDDGTSDYVDVQGFLIPHLYNDEDPINDEIAEMDSCITKVNWNPTRFKEIFNKYYKGDSYFIE